jgi:ketosteroid isomerase-like protein
LAQVFSGPRFANPMATIGGSVIARQAFQLFEGLRIFDAAAAVKDMADDVVFQSPWSGRLVGKAAVEAFLKDFLGDVHKRPSLTIIDVSGDGHLTRMKLSASGRFGRAPQHLDMQVLTLTGLVRQVLIE